MHHSTAVSSLSTQGMSTDPSGTAGTGQFPLFPVLSLCSKTELLLIMGGHSGMFDDSKPTINFIDLVILCSFTGTFTKCLNMGSYNYLGFAECDGPCAKASQKTAYDLGLGVCSPRQELGSKLIDEIISSSPFIASFLPRQRNNGNPSRIGKVRCAFRRSRGRDNIRHGLCDKRAQLAQFVDQGLPRYQRREQSCLAHPGSQAIGCHDPCF